MSSSILLFPRPRSLEPGSGFLSLPAEAAEGSLPAFFAALKQGLPSVRLASDPALAKEEYRLTVAPDGAEIVFSCEEGLFRAATSLRQLIRRYAGRLPCLRIQDGPQLPRRAICWTSAAARSPGRTRSGR